MDFIFKSQASSLYYAIGAILAASASTFLAKLYNVRKRTLKFQRQGLAMPPVNPVLGHLLILARILSKLPKDAHPHYLPDQLRRAYPEMGPIFYIDGWPFMTFTLVLASPSTLAQVTTEHNSPKFPAIKDFLYPLTNGKDIVSMDGREWKMWRNIFNPGFSASHLITVVPDIVKETLMFCKVLQQYAESQSVFSMKNLTDNLAMDVIGKVVLDSNIDCQTSSHPMVDALRQQMRWMAFGNEGNPIQQYHPFRPFVHWYNTWQMDKYILPEVNARIANWKRQDSAQDIKRGKSVIDLALKAYLKNDKVDKSVYGSDKAFIDTSVNQMKLFLFSGHDTTSSTICYIFHVLSTYPNILSRLRAEHDQVFGSDPAQATACITNDPYLINKLPYTVAVIKETMRLFPAASTTRSGEEGFNVADALGQQYPTDGCLIWLIPHAIQRDPAFWPQADKLIPERWLVGPGDPLHPVKNTWRPFEHGPRACIGIELSMIEMKVAMVLVARSFDIEIMYKELDAGRKQKGIIRTVEGERAYQLGMGQPSENLPCRVRSVRGHVT